MNLNDFLDNQSNINFQKLHKNAILLPKSLSMRDFKDIIAKNSKKINRKLVQIQTPYEKVKLNPATTFKHYTLSGNKKENRIHLNATLLPTLTKPKFITQDDEDIRYYYKVFKDCNDENKFYHIISVVVDRNGEAVNVSNYEANAQRLLNMLKDYELLYSKK